MSQRNGQPVEPGLKPLTPREREILTLLAQGLSATEIAEKLTLALSSVKWYLQRLYNKLGVSSKLSAVVKAAELGLLASTPSGSAPGPALGVVAFPGATPESLEPKSALKHNLPLYVTRFFGREAEIVQLRERLDENRLVTFTGPGGVGKTRLSLRAVEELLPGFSDGVWLVELAPLADPALVPQHVAAALGVRDDPGRPVLETLIAYLRGRQLIVVLDNCEHLLEACARLADALLRTCPRLRLLASSREPLGIQGEAVFAIPSLPFPEPGQTLPPETLIDYASVRLFLDRARLVLPDYRLTPHNAAAVARICQRLDGIPLAIEMAAARLRLLDAATLAARLDDAFGLLTGGSRTAPPRHQTLRATIDWSYQLLSEAERLLLQRLSGFAGGCVLDAAEAVCGGDGLASGRVLAGLTGLVDKSMVLADLRPGEATRYRLLETVRQYANEKLEEAGDSERLRLRHRDYYLAFAETHVPTPNIRANLTWAAILEADIENLRHALEWSFSEAGLLNNVEAGPRLAIAMFADFDSPSSRSTYQERVEWYNKFIALCRGRADVSAQVTARLLVSAAHTLIINDPRAALAWVQEAVEISRRLGLQGRQTLMQCLGELAMEHSAVGEVEQALTASAEAETIFQALEREKDPPNPDLDTMAHFAQGKAGMAAAQGRYQDAKMHASESLRLYEAAGNTLGRYYPLLGLGFASLALKEYDQARIHFLAATHLADEWGFSWAMADSRYALGATELERGNLDAALKHCEESLRLAAPLPDYNIVAHCLGLGARIMAQQGQPVRAAHLVGAAHSVYQKQGRKPWDAWSLDTMLPGWRDGPDYSAINDAFIAGQTMSPEQAVVYALENPDP